MLHALWHIPRKALIGFVKVYQIVLSPHLGSACRFTPTCSNYTIEALRKYGAVKGFILGTHRILRCNPWGGHGYDPPRWYGEAASVAHDPPPPHNHQNESANDLPSDPGTAST
ncbi:MAG: membrane protein insertion efficiency factor YidD [Bacteroidota bacterium]|nr:membrane protein insertion efficiency factor YidD [Bacteroidota bacterium]